MENISYFRTNGECNMREKAGSVHDLVCTIPCGEVITSDGVIRCYHGAPWIHVYYDNKEGFVNDIFLREIE